MLFLIYLTSCQSEHITKELFDAFVILFDPISEIAVIQINVERMIGEENKQTICQCGPEKVKEKSGEKN